MARRDESDARKEYHRQRMAEWRKRPLTIDGIEAHAQRYFWPRVSSKWWVSDCSFWEGSRDRDGYGNVVFQNRVVKAHRYAFMLHFGRLVTPGLEIGHTCDNPPCVRIDHLREWTSGDNQRDKHQKGRAVIAVGERAGGARISNERVGELRAMAAELGWPGKRGAGGNREAKYLLMAAFPEVSVAQLARIVNGTSRAKG